MNRPLQRLLAVLFALSTLMPLAAGAQAPQPPAPPSAAMSQDELDSLLAPIALHPDQLLAQVLMAATYPLDIASAQRFVRDNPDLKGDALDRALQDKDWDPSVQSLAAYPSVIDMMGDKLVWTQQLGDAFLADPDAVMDTVQRLRQKAKQAGNLQSNDQQKVVAEQQAIVIEPAQSSVVYVPAYNPMYVYGPWWVPYYPPFFWYPPPMWGYPPYATTLPAAMIGFGVGWAIANNHWGWARPAWGSGDINIDIDRNNFVNTRPAYKDKVQNGKWEHRPEARKGVGYGDAATRDKFKKVDAGAVSARRDMRGLDGAGDGARPGTRPGADGAARPGDGVAARPGDRPAARPGDMGNFDRPSTRPAGDISATGRPATRELPGGTISSGRPIDRTMPSSMGGGSMRGASAFNPGYSGAQARDYGNRGAQSRASMPSSRPAPSARPGPSARPMPAGGGGRGGGGRGR